MAHGKPKVVANWVLNELLRELPGDDDRAVAACPIPPAHLVGLLALIDDGTISGKIAKDVFEKMYRSGETAARDREPRGAHPGGRRGRAGRRGGPGARGSTPRWWTIFGPERRPRWAFWWAR